jgi:NADPH:quinone reductase-like Zn-dependent oxidoreductase
MPPTRAALRQVGMLFEAGRIGSVIDSIHPLAAIAQAHERSESGQAVGKIIVDIQA